MNPLSLLVGDVVETTHFQFLSVPPGWVLALVIAPAVLLFARWLYARRRVEISSLSNRVSLSSVWPPAGQR